MWYPLICEKLPLAEFYDHEVILKFVCLGKILIFVVTKDRDDGSRSSVHENDEDLDFRSTRSNSKKQSSAMGTTSPLNGMARGFGSLT